MGEEVRNRGTGRRGMKKNCDQDVIYEKKDEKKFYKNKIHSKMFYLVSLWLTDNSPASINDEFHYRVHKTIILGCDITL